MRTPDQVSPQKRKRVYSYELRILTHGLFKNDQESPVVVVHAFNPSIWEVKTVDLYEFKASLVYKASSRAAKTTERNPVSKTNNKKNPERKRCSCCEQQDSHVSLRAIDDVKGLI